MLSRDHHRWLLSYKSTCAVFWSLSILSISLRGASLFIKVQGFNIFGGNFFSCIYKHMTDILVVHKEGFELRHGVLH